MRREGEATEVGTIVSEQRAFDHPFFSVVSRTVRTPDGAIRDPQLLWDRNGKKFVIAVVTDPEGRYVFVEEPKYGCMRRMVLVPTGGVKKDESIVAAARREFIEETGYDAENWHVVLADSLIDFADKTDGGDHYIVCGYNAHKIGAPKSAHQTPMALTMGEIWFVMCGGRMPAMSMAAVLFVDQIEK